MRIILALSFVIALTITGFLLSSFKPADETIPNKVKRTSDKGLYITHHVAQTNKWFNDIRKQAKAAGLNTMVIDGKGFLEKPLLEALKGKKITWELATNADPWFSKLINQLHQEGFIVSVRLVVFKDDHLVLARPDLAIQLKGGGIYRDHKQGRWADPYAEEVRIYNVKVAERAALCGADEVQFDYIRFPTEGRAKQAVYSRAKKDETKIMAISLFLQAAQEHLKKYNVSIAADVFGVVAWEQNKDSINLGQDLREMGKHIDVLSPMLYPSHFHAGYDGFANPGSYPYYFMHSGLKKTQEILSSEAVTIVPWVQGFNLRSPNYGPGYILEQIKAANDLGIKHYLIWNARNVYDTAFSALKR